MTLHAFRRALLLSVLTIQAWMGLVLFDLLRPAGFARVCR